MMISNLTFIGPFGGNRNEITLMGHSTGAASAVYHSLSSRSNGYIRTYNNTFGLCNGTMGTATQSTG